MKATYVWEEEEELSQKLTCGNDSSCFTHSKHCFLLLLPALVLGTEANDFPGLGEMDWRIDQRRG